MDVDDHIYPQELGAGPVTRADLSMANTHLPIYTFEAIGAELRSSLEDAVGRYLQGIARLEESFRSDDFSPTWYTATRRPLAVSGFSYSFNQSPPQGERVEVSGLEPQKLYRVAVTERVVSQSMKGGGSIGFLGSLPKLQWTGRNEIDAQEQYLRHHNPATVLTSDRIRQY